MQKLSSVYRKPMSEHVFFKTIPAHQGQIGLITLNRPEALNALSGEMILALLKQLQAWAQDSKISIVVIQGAGDRAFCAGGDLKMVYNYGIANYKDGLHFYEAEYELDLLIAKYRKPYISLLNGIAMGGGLGISLHGARVVGTEKLQLAMPECGIGFFPDVAAAHFLARCPHNIGIYLGLTGNIIGIADACYANLIPAYVASNKLESLLRDVAAADLENDPLATIDAIIARYKQDPGPSSLQEHANIIDECFGYNSVEEIIEALSANGSAWAKQQVAILNSKSPTSLKVSLRELHYGASVSLQECLAKELQLAERLMQQHDVHEGIRAALIDKTRDPKWSPARLADVKEQDINKLFE
ncbi:MAG TPA: enoyl-CoA hydratase/isomerase family protein [Gammaproteobacteria bacterium]|nr:enoyl-CoA hydratase/isomerase family protein [Gammaproteobacteria bacterium]